MKIKLIIALLLSLNSCATRQLVMSAGAVSMTKPNAPKGAKLATLGPVTGKFCPEAFAKSSGKEMGMIDEAVKNAQETSKADFIKNAQVYASGNCYEIEGEGVRLQ